MQDNIHPVHNVFDGVFNTSSGVKVNILNPTPDMINLGDIAKGLSNICRFGGQIHSFSSVARHTLLVWYLAPDHLKKLALLHDATEAYLGDIIKPLKVLLEPIYGPIEKAFERIIFSKYGLPFTDTEAIKPYDKLALEIEHAFFRRNDRRLISAFKEIAKIAGDNSAHIQLLELLRANFGMYEGLG